MGTLKYNNTQATQTTLVVLGLFVFTGIFILAAKQGSPPIFDLRWNAYALLTVISIVLNVVFLVLSSRINIRGTEAVWFTVFIAAMTVFGIGEFFMRLSATPEGAIFWGKFLSIGALESSAAFLFVLHYLNPSVKHVRTTVFLLFGSIFLIIFTASGNLLVNNNVSDIKLFPFGYYNDVGSAYALYFGWILAAAGTSIYLMLRFLRNNHNPVLAKQTKLFLIAFLFPLVGAIITDAILPIFGILLFSWHGLFGTVTAGIMLWGLKRYRVFRISPALLSEEILATMREAVLVVDETLQIQLVNQEAEKIFSLESDELMTRTVLDFIEGGETTEIKGKLASLQGNDTLSLDNIIIATGDNNKIYARVSVSRVTEENGIVGFVFVLADVTELQNSYVALENEKAGVEHTVEVRTKELREAQARLIDTDKIKTEFVLLTSHNLRTPLTTIRGSIELLSLPKIHAKEKAELLDNLQTSTKKLGELIEDLLTISNIEAGGSLTLENIKSKELLDPLVDYAKKHSATTKNKLAVNIKVGDSSLAASTDRLRTAVRNILENAFKFTRKGSVSFGASVDNHTLLITIKDTGRGIPAEEIPKLFTKFHRATDTLKYDYDGEGIGLYLSKLIVEEHKGKIRIDSEMGVGTIFTITLPISL